MTLPYSVSKAVFHGNGSAMRFPFPFRVWDAAHLDVRVLSPSGVMTPVTEFEVELTPSGGVVTCAPGGAPLPEGWTLVVLRDMPFTQNVNLMTGTRFDPQVIEDSLDMAAAERQQLREVVERTVKVEPGSDVTPDALIDVLRRSSESAAQAAEAASQNARRSDINAAATDQWQSAARQSAEDAAQSAAAAAQDVAEAVSRVEAEGDAQTARISAQGDAQLARVQSPEWMVQAWRESMAGTPVFWPSLTIPLLADGLPYGLPLDGALASLTTYPRLARVLCPSASNTWAPAWYRATAAGARSASGTHIKLDDWRDGFPQVVGSAASSQHQSTVLVSTTNGSANITVTNNLSAGGTLLTPKVSTANLYPGLRVTGTGIPAGATVVSVSGATVTLSAAATVTAAGVQATVWGRVLGSWQGDAMRRLDGRIGRFNGIMDAAEGVFTYEVSGSGSSGSGWSMLYAIMDASRTTPTAPTLRPAGPAATAIIIV